MIPGVAYTALEVAWVGETELSAKASGRKITKANFPWAASGRAIANGCDTGFTKLIFDAETGRIIGGGIVGPNGGDMIGEICLAIEMGCDAADIYFHQLNQYFHNFQFFQQYTIHMIFHQ